MPDKIKILVIGEPVGKIARTAIKNGLPEIKKKHKPNLTITNAENLSHGLGASPRTIKEMIDAGVDVFTSGNHIWDKDEINEELAKPNPLVLRPANYPADLPGKGDRVLEIDGHKILLLNLIGRVFMKPVTDDPFRVVQALRTQHGENFSAILVDFHAEATSEKVAMGHFLDGYASAVWGTHTHIPTADQKILSGGTAYVTDVGMTGAKDSVLGVEKEIILYNFLHPKGRPHDIVENGTCEINAILITINTTSRKSAKIDRIYQEVEV